MRHVVTMLECEGAMTPGWNLPLQPTAHVPIPGATLPLFINVNITVYSLHYSPNRLL